MNILKVTVLFPIWSLLLPFNVQIFPQNQILFRVIINGEEKRTNSAFVILVSEHLPTGEFKVAFNVHQLPRVEIPSGVYFYQLEIRYPITCSLNEQGSPQVASSGQAITPTKKRFSLNNIFSIFIQEDKMKLLITVLFATLSIITFAQEGWNDVSPAGTYSGLYGLYALDSENVWVVGDEGIILNTTDGGTTWSEISCPVTYPLYNVHFINADTGWVGGDNESITEIMRTTDSGLSWELKTLTSSASEGNNDIEFIHGNPGDPPRGFVTAGLSHVWTTDDYGENWVTSPIGGCGAGDLESICFIDKDEGWFVGTPSAVQEVSIVHTTDGGQTFDIQDNPTDPDIKLNCVSFADNQHGIAAGVGTTILYTSDGGINWESSTVSNYRWQSVNLNQSGKAWVVGRNGTIVYSTDWGYTWTTQESGVASELREVIFINDNEGWIVGGGTGLPGVILHTTNGGVITDVYEDEIVSEFVLHQNYPNPFNPSTTIKFSISEFGFTKLTIYDILGNEIETLVNEQLQAGEYEVEFNTSSIKHLPSSGVYFYQLKAGEFIHTKKMLMIK